MLSTPTSNIRSTTSLTVTAIPFGVLVAESPPYSASPDIHEKDRISGPTEWTLYVNVRFNKLAGKELPISYAEHGEDLQFVVGQHFTSTGKVVLPDWKIDSDMGGESDYFTEKALLVLASVFKANRLGTLIVGGPCAPEFVP